MKSLPPAPPVRLHRYRGLLLATCATLILATLLFLIPLLRPLRFLGSLAVVAILVSASWPRMTTAKRVYFVLWAVMTLAIGARNPLTAMVGGVLFALLARRDFVPWTGAQSRRQLIVLSGSYFLLFVLRGLVQHATQTAPVHGVFVRVEQAVFALAMAWLWLGWLRAVTEIGRRGIRRAPLRLKLVMSFGIFAATPAVFAVLLLSLLAWVRSGQYRAQSLEADLRMHAAVRPWIEPLRRGAPASSEALLAGLQSRRDEFARQGVAAAVLSHTARGWRLAGVAAGPESLFLPPVLPVAHDSLYLGTFAIRAGRYHWLEAAVWPATTDRDSLALLTFETVDSTRIEDIAHAIRSDVLLIGGGTGVKDSDITINLSLAGAKAVSSAARDAQTRTRLEKVSRRQTQAFFDSVATAPAESLIAQLGILLIGTGHYREFRGGTISPVPVGVYSMPTLNWTAAGWSGTTVPVFTRPAFAEIAGWRNVYRDPAGKGVDFLLWFIFAMAIIAWVVSMAWGARIARLITDSTSRLQIAAHAIGSGDFTTRVVVPSRDEFGELADAFNTMTAGLAAGRDAMRERDRLQHELELARRIQTRLLPAHPPQFAAIEIAATNAMSEQVGGDYYDFVPLSDGRIGIAIADVSGHGVGAALLMSSVKASLVSSAAVDSSPSGITGRVNRLLESSVEPGKFVTFFFAALDPVTLRLDYVNAGHPAPLLLRRDGSLEKLDVGGFILGIMSDALYEQGTVTLGAGDTLALFTDGVTEAEAPDKSLYEESRVEALLRREQGRSAAAILERLVDDIRVFEDGIAACDDLTVILLRVA